MAKKELYFSLDIETDGPIPAANSMLSFGCVALDTEGNEVSTFEANLELLPDATPNPETMAWWKQFPEAWDYCRSNIENPVAAMSRFVAWVDETCGDKYRPVAVAMPNTFDYMFMYWYMMMFAGRSPFSFSCVDMKTMAMTMLKKDFRSSGKRSWPKRWFSKFPHTHKAIDDAREQGHTFITMLRENRGR